MSMSILDALGAGGSPGAPALSNSASSIQDRFLTLLVTQLKNQDPLNPLDNAQLTTQLSQISTVTGLEKLNNTMSGLSAALSASQALATVMSGTSSIGRELLSPGNMVRLADGKASGAFELAERAERVNVRLIGPAGDVVRQIALQGQEPGLKRFDWDGSTEDGRTAKDGVFTFHVEALRDGKTVDSKTLSIGTVTGVAATAGNPAFVVDGAREVRFADVYRIQ